MEIDGSVKQGHKLATGPIRDFYKKRITPEELEDKINEYFNESDVVKKTITYYNQGKPVSKEVKIYTFPGLCLYLGFCARDQYWKEMKDAESPYQHTLKKGYVRIQQYLEELAIHNSNPAGPVFILKNMDYSDMQTVNQNVTETVQPKVLPLDRETGKLTRKLLNQGEPVNEIKQEKIA